MVDVQHVSVTEVKVYGEEQFKRKLRLERSKWPSAAEDTPSDQFCACVEIRHLAQLARAARLSPLERRVFILSLRGASSCQVAEILGVSRQRVTSRLSIVKRKLRFAARDRYLGLHEVYWQEVRRYIYRRPRQHMRHA